MQRPGIFWLVYGLALVKFVLPFLLQHPVYEPHRDEFLYLAAGRHPAWGDPGAPLLSLLSWGSNLLGGGFFWIKFWPALFGAMTYVLVARMILLLGGGRFALMLGFLPFIFGYFLQLHFMLAPGFLGVYFQLLMVYGVVFYFRTGRVRGLYWTGIAFGLWLLSQSTAGWQTMPIWRAGFVRDLLFFNFPGIFIWGAGLYFVFAKSEWRFLGWALLGVVVAVGSFREDADQAMGVFPAFFAFGAVALERVRALRGRVFRFGLIGFAMVTGFVVDTVFLPMVPPRELAAYYSRYPLFRQLGYLRWADGKNHALPARFAAMLGWEEMAMKAARAYESLDSVEKTSVIINSESDHCEGGALEYYGPKYSLPPVTARGGEVFILTAKDPAVMREFATAAIVDSVTHPFSMEYRNYIIVARGRKPVSAGNQVAHIRE